MNQASQIENFVRGKLSNWKGNPPTHRYTLSCQKKYTKYIEQVVRQIEKCQEELNGEEEEKANILIDLEYDSIVDDDCKHLQKANLFRLIHLKLSFNLIGPEGALALSGGNWPFLKKIYFNYNQIGDKGCLYLLRGCWRNIELMGLRDNGITEKGCKYLSKGGWPKLQTLGLASNPIENRGFCYIVDGEWPQLKIISLDSCQVGDSGCQRLSKNRWGSLNNVRLNSNCFGIRGIKILKGVGYSVEHNCNVKQ